MTRTTIERVLDMARYVAAELGDPPLNHRGVVSTVRDRYNHEWISPLSYYGVKYILDEHVAATMPPAPDANDEPIF